jgi:hypothetical protein
MLQIVKKFHQATETITAPTSVVITPIFFILIHTLVFGSFWTRILSTDPAKCVKMTLNIEYGYQRTQN